MLFRVAPLSLAAFLLSATAPVADYSVGHLTARAAPLARPAPFARATRLKLPGGALAYVPAGTNTAGPLPLLIAFHGTGGTAISMIDIFHKEADARGFVLLAPAAQGQNWDAVVSFFDDRDAGKPSARTTWPAPVFGRDAENIDAALAALYGQVAIDPQHIGLIGFSSGAGYALMLGAANPDVFGSMTALSPGLLLLPGRARGGQSVFVAHGTGDKLLAFRRTRDVIVPRLIELGYRVTFRPFKGGHEINVDATDEAIRLFLTTDLGQPSP